MPHLLVCCEIVQLGKCLVASVTFESGPFMHTLDMSLEHCPRHKLFVTLWAWPRCSRVQFLMSHFPTKGPECL